MASPGEERLLFVGTASKRREFAEEIAVLMSPAVSKAVYGKKEENWGAVELTYYVGGKALGRGRAENNLRA